MLKVFKHDAEMMLSTCAKFGLQASPDKLWMQSAWLLYMFALLP